MLDLTNKKILVTGGSGFLGQHLVKKLTDLGVKNIFVPRSIVYDLRRMEVCQKVVENMDTVIHLAAIVGGIGFNQANPGSTFYDNLLMGTQLMEAARLAKVQKFVALGTICSYPKFTTVPFKEENLWKGYPEETNAPYGLAKKMLLVQSEAYRHQYGFNSINLLAVNLYGPGDKYNPSQSHVMPALIRKVFEAKMFDYPSVEVWGTGKPTREFIYVDDAVEGIISATIKYDKSDPINLGSGMEISIKKLILMICHLVGYHGRIVWNTSKPDGQPRRRLDTTKAFKEFGFKAKTKFDDGLKRTIEWYQKTYLYQI